MYIEAKNGPLLINITESECDLCGCCVGICPEDAIELSADQIGIFAARCTNCAKCIWSCPLEAIHFYRSGIPVEQLL
jgi:anaerobic sulfite reductase subunit C